VHRARERDVEEAEVFPALLAVAEPAVPGDVGPLPPTSIVHTSSFWSS
jgi:hypothetical protein